MVRNFVWPFFLVMLTACSNFVVDKGEQKTEVSENEAQNTLSVEDAEKKLDVLSKEATEAGEAAVNYLASDLFLKAGLASNTGDVATSVILHKHLVKLRPKDDFLKFKYSIELIKLGNLEEAKLVLEQLFNNKNNSYYERSGILLGGIHSANKELDKALVIYQKVLKFNPKSEDACILLAKSYHQKKQLNKSLELLNKCQRSDRDNPIFSFYKGKTHLDSNKLQEAIKSFKEVLKIDPGYFQAALAIGYIFEKQQQFANAIITYNRFLLGNPENPPILSRLVQVLFALERYSEIIPHLEKLISFDTSNINLKIKLAILYTDAKKFNQAKVIFHELEKEISNPDKIYFYLGALYQETNEFEEALTYYGKVPTESPLYQDSIVQSAHLLNSMALVLDNENKENYKERLFDFIQEKEKFSDKMKVELNVIKAGHLENTNELQKAIETLEGLTEAEDFHEGHKYYLATLLEKFGQHEKSYSLVMKILEKEPSNAHMWNFLGYSLVERGVELEKAYEYILKAVKLKPDDGFIRDSLGWYYFKVGKIDKALVELKKAREKVADDVVISKHLAEVYQAKKNYEMAKKFYLEALRNSRFENERIDVLKSMESLNVRIPASETQE